MNDPRYNAWVNPQAPPWDGWSADPEAIRQPPTGTCRHWWCHHAVLNYTFCCWCGAMRPVITIRWTQ